MITLNWFKASPSSLNLLDNKSGLYVISVLLKNGEYAAVYVGQSVRLKDRVAEHFSENETNDELKDLLKRKYDFKISYAYLDEKDLDGAEKYLIGNLRPPLNKQDGNGDERIKCSEPNVVPWPF